MIFERSRGRLDHVEDLKMIFKGSVYFAS